MKKITLLLMFAALGLFTLNAQIIYEENFSDYASGSQPAGWTIYDEDGDGLSWMVIKFDTMTKPVLVSDSWNTTTGFPLTPDNYAVTPAIDLSGVEEETVTLSWDVAGVDPDYSQENYTIYVATENSVDAFLASDTYYGEVVTDNGPGGLDNFYTKTLDISAFIGETIYVAIRHHDVTDVFRIAFDNIKVEAGTLGIEDNQIQGFTHYFNPTNYTLTLQADSAFEQFELYNILGQKVVSKKLSSNNEIIDLSNLSSGVYISRVQVGESVTSFKIAIR